MTSAEALLDWMSSRSGTVTMREVCSAGPRGTRRKADAEPALAELIAAGRIVEASSYPRAFRVVGPGAAPGSSGSRLLDMLADAAADCEDVPPAFAAYWAAVTIRDRLVARTRVRNGLPAECDCGKIGHLVDRAVADAFDCELAD